MRDKFAKSKIEKCKLFQDKKGVHTMRLKQAIELLHPLVLTINKVTCPRDKTISQIKDQYAIITDI